MPISPADYLDILRNLRLRLTERLAECPANKTGVAVTLPEASLPTMLAVCHSPRLPSGFYVGHVTDAILFEKGREPQLDFAEVNAIGRGVCVTSYMPYREMLNRACAMVDALIAHWRVEATVNLHDQATQISNEIIRRLVKGA